MINNPDIDSNTTADNAHSADESDTPLKVTHIIHFTNETEPKPRALLAALEINEPKSALVACSEASECELLARYLMHYGFKTEFCTEEHNTQAVASNLAKCAHNSDLIFICQSNLIDNHSLEKIPFLLNYDMVGRPQVYEKLAQSSFKIPRIIANLVTSKEFSLIAPIKAHCLIEFQEQALPSSDEVLNLSAQRLLKGLNQEAQQIELGQFESLAKRLLAKDNVMPALALLLRHYLLKPSQAQKSEPAREKREYGRQPVDRRREHSREPAPRHEPKEAISAEEKPENDTGITRLYITLGRQDNFHDLADLAQYLSAQSGVDLGHFSGSGMIRDTSAHIEVDSDVADQIITALNNSKKPDALTDQGEGSLVVCERARQNTQRPVRRPPHKRHGRFQRR